MDQAKRTVSGDHSRLNAALAGGVSCVPCLFERGQAQLIAERDAHISMIKVTATDTMKFCADHAVRILGGMGCMRGTLSERMYREVKVLSIGGGADELMKELAGRQLGI